MRKNSKSDEKSIEYLYKDLDHYSSKYFHFDNKLSNYSSLFFKIYALAFGLSVTLYGIFSNNAIVQNISIFDGNITIIEVIIWILSPTNLIVVVLILEILDLKRVLSIVSVELDSILLKINTNLKKTTTYTGELTLDSARALVIMVNITWCIGYCIIMLSCAILIVEKLSESDYEVLVYFGICILHIIGVLIIYSKLKTCTEDIKISKDLSKKIGIKFRRMVHNAIKNYKRKK